MNTGTWRATVHGVTTSQTWLSTKYSQYGGVYFAFELWCWRRLLRVPWTARRSNQSILKISPGISLEGMMLKLKLQYFGHLMRRVDAGRDWGQEEKGMTEDEMVGWHHWLDVHEFEQAPGVGEGQGSLVCCSPWGRKESDMTEQLNWTEASAVPYSRALFTQVCAWLYLLYVGFLDGSTISLEGFGR